MSEVTGGARKFDNGKPSVVRGFFWKFSEAIKAVTLASEYGAIKYEYELESKEFLEMEGCYNRVTDAGGRHLLDQAPGEDIYDKESHLLHAIHQAWTSMARLERMLKDGISPTRPKEKKNVPTRDGDLTRLGSFIWRHVNLEHEAKAVSGQLGKCLEGWTEQPESSIGSPIKQERRVPVDPSYIGPIRGVRSDSPTKAGSNILPGDYSYSGVY